MPDFTIEVYYHCVTAENWETEVPASKPGDPPYVVSWGETPHDIFGYGWYCTCKAFQFGHGASCKHIKQVELENKRCGWMEFTDGSSVVRDSEGNAVCPKCEEPTFALRHAV